ncbi:MAG: exodeoxyribonuclease VII large subunit, partial [Gammaproteobacteria bacterium]|nr:exodeoxyribonuclease VII large subunit [Gammaproteobacteria bacterium]
FNEEVVARAIYSAHSPIISGVGHETDFTIADLVADVRAPTPSGAAEIAVPDRADWLRHLQHLNLRTARSVRLMLDHIRLRSNQSEHRLNRCSPSAVLQQRSQLLDELNRRTTHAIAEEIKLKNIKINTLNDKLKLNSPEKLLTKNKQRLSINLVRLNTGIKQLLKQRRHQIALSAAKLHTVSPLATLDRGYAIVSDAENKQLISDTRQVAAGQQLTTRLANGEITSEVIVVSAQDTINND